MSLLVWLPLNGDLNNQGLSNAAFAQYNSTGGLGINNSGKISQNCYERTSVTNNAYRSNINFSFAEDVSMCCWAYVSNTPGDSANGLITNHNHADGSGFGITVKQISTSDYRISCSAGKSGSDRVYHSWYGTTNIKNAWHHLALTYKRSTGDIKLYVDGICEKIRAGYLGAAVGSNPFDLFNWSTGNISSTNYRPLCKLNDVRLYDHCLSAKEVKEISKGLVLHYKLTGIGQENLLKNTNFDSRYTSGTTSQHTSLMANDWGGYNSGVGNPTTVYHAHLIQHEGQYVYRYVKNSSNSWLGISQQIKDRTTVGTTYTFSCELYRVSGTNYPHGGHYTKTSSTASNSFVTNYSFSAFANAPVGQWIRYSATITVPASCYINDGVYFYIYGHTGGSGEFLMRHPKLEVGSKATPWIPNTSDTIYGSLGFNSTIEHDCSGYSHNGTKVNVKVFAESPRYNTSEAFLGTTVDNSSNTLTGASYITAGLPLPASSALTVSWWGKITKYGRGGIFETTGVTSDYVNGTDYNTTAIANWDSTFGVYNGSTRINLYSNLGIPNSSWQLNTITFDGTNVKYYKNGTLISTNALSGTLPAFNGIKIGIGKAGGVYRQIQQYVSDFRIYVTALSASDVKELYQIPISVDKDGDIFGLSYNESGTKHSFYKTGIVEGALWEKDEPFSLMKNNIPFKENLFKNSNSFGLTGSDFPSVSTRTVGKVVVSSDSIGNAYAWIQGSIEGGMTSIFNSTKTMTLSIDIKVENVTNTNATGLISIDYRKSDHSALIQNNKNLIMDGKWHRYILPITANNGGQTQSLLCLANFQNLSGATIYYKNIKYEEGSTGSPWCPSKSEGFTSNMTTMVAPISANQIIEV